ncbi:GNAT family N-acetyltransferase [Acidithiobacillus thiooxidans]|jgi:predicted N-acetyltransferase YhbS|uniref:GNAT family N-acetyltransferase n=1 Tax=Acidithiobacillus thiooxidans TaxID=930 RepID=UPI00285563E3|nr:GNAT family N-acetyltransferase [Acidithiobacillus thiooxidans]MDR7926537.1 GNAT family N-acetyltransferase [Acidithiobacillus thiooxidans]MDR7926552.1 GNAT family N-acetyltransferase [Acidithiobacillus thiooxidans]
MIIRPITESDVEEISQIFVACFSAPPWNEEWTTESARACLRPKLETQSSRGYVAILNDSIVGTAFGQIESGLNKNKFNIQEFFVLPSVQRQGIGKSLLSKIFSDLSNTENIGSIYLLTIRGSSAHGFYEKFGFSASKKLVVMGAAVNLFDKN